MDQSSNIPSADRRLRPIEPTRETTTPRLLRWGLAALFLFAGVAKLVGLEAMEQTFERFGYSEGFMMLIGALEVAGAIGLLVPQLIFWAALGLCGIMFGAIANHLVHDPIYMALPALIVFALLASVAWGRVQSSSLKRRSAVSTTEEQATPHSAHTHRG